MFLVNKWTKNNRQLDSLTHFAGDFGDLVTEGEAGKRGPILQDQETGEPLTTVHSLIFWIIGDDTLLHLTHPLLLQVGVK